jgi:hypothetical protein
MKRNSYPNPYLGVAILAGAGIGIAVGCLLFNEDLRHRLGRKMRKAGRAWRNQTEELRETAGSLWEMGGRNLKGVRKTGQRMYERVAG